ncbi:(Fe-S)-binding protein [Aeoliella mucimassa]|uniref:Lactate utilization protein A n=1 Tax=Aeoliella mucimassa TaxID=2527972 RepID=A0A518AT45_9BACT|nr:(Fe-S)-binding protein [Aeoliella mucimassa]QDU57876.1 Lactate utilization protein A [Aeoliella mucimassa]
MNVGLFIPCYIDQFYPRVGLATVDLLERFGATVDYPEQQTCCGQPMANTGCQDDARVVAEHFLQTFKDYEYVVAPSGSCVAMVRHHYAGLFGTDARVEAMAKKTFELCEFLTDVVGVEQVEGEFPFRVGLHNACHGLRELRLGNPSEHMAQPFNKVASLLAGLRGLELVELSRSDDCCGFGGTFAVSEEAVSCQMGNDRLADHESAGTQVLASADMSCLMHLGGLARRQNKPLAVMHVAEILAGYEVPQPSPARS